MRWLTPIMNVLDTLSATLGWSVGSTIVSRIRSHIVHSPWRCVHTGKPLCRRTCFHSCKRWACVAAARTMTAFKNTWRTRMCLWLWDTSGTTEPGGSDGIHELISHQRGRRELHCRLLADRWRWKGSEQSWRRGSPQYTVRRGHCEPQHLLQPQHKMGQHAFRLAPLQARQEERPADDETMKWLRTSEM
ncbi:hypothetical protein EDB87DRAFT_808234 [Lactarius vividus]|nr:hypothetical protein EDB87DRAFT_808234 [Lactarius vividus]